MARVYFRPNEEWAPVFRAYREYLKQLEAHEAALARGEVSLAPVKVPEPKERAPERGHFYADYQGSDGARRQERLPTASTRKEAEGKLRELQEKAWRARRGLDVEQVQGVPSVEEAARLYLETVKHSPSLIHIRGQLNNHVVPYFRRKLLSEVTGHDIDAFRSHLLAEGLAHASVVTIVVRLRALFTWARQTRRWRGVNPFEDAKKFKLPTRRPLYFLAEERDAIIEHGGDYALALEFAFYTGARPGEWRAAQWDDVDLSAGTWTVRRSGRRSTTKTGEERTIPLPPHLLQKLRELKLRSRSRWVLPGKRGGMVDRMACERAMHDAMARAKVEPKGRTLKHTRSTFATLLLEETGDIFLVSKLLGHSSPAITARHYAHAHLAYLRKGVERLAPPKSSRDGSVTNAPSAARQDTDSDEKRAVKLGGCS